jgi:hypothetical protein
VAEGEPADSDYLFFGLLMESEDEGDWNWVEMRLSELIAVPGCVRWMRSSSRGPFRMRCRIRMRTK